MTKIKRVGVHEVRSGMYVVQEDAENLTDAEVNADWEASEQDWQHVVTASHKADVSRLTLAMYNGETYTSSWGTGIVWLLVDDQGEPVIDEIDLD